MDEFFKIEVSLAFCGNIVAEFDINSCLFQSDEGKAPSDLQTLSIIEAIENDF
jgi:hypothetical protein